MLKQRGCKEVPMRHTGKLAPNVDIDTAMRKQHPARIPQELAQWLGKNLEVLEGRGSAARSEYERLWEDSIAREWRGGLETEVTETVGW